MSGPEPRTAPIGGNVVPDFNEMFDKAKEKLSENSDKDSDGLDKAKDFVDEKTGGRFSDQLDKGQEKAQEFLDEQGSDGNNQN
jgi:hypothetical protein